MDAFAGVTAMDTNVGAVTVKTVEPDTLPEVALMLEVPAPTPVATPELLMLATAVTAEAHVTPPVKF